MGEIKGDGLGIGNDAITFRPSILGVANTSPTFGMCTMPAAKIALFTSRADPLIVTCTLRTAVIIHIKGDITLIVGASQRFLDRGTFFLFETSWAAPARSTCARTCLGCIPIVINIAPMAAWCGEVGVGAFGTTSGQTGPRGLACRAVWELIPRPGNAGLT